jgi:hypothetical protein
MQPNNEQRKRRPLPSMINVVLVVTVLFGISWVLGRLSVNWLALFILGCVAIFLGYGIDRLFFGGGYAYTGRGEDHPRTEFDRYRIEAGGTPGTDLEELKRPPIFLRDLIIGGVLAILASLVLSRFF